MKLTTTSLTIALLLVGATVCKARLDGGDGGRNLKTAAVAYKINRDRCDKEMVDLNFSFRTDRDPDETMVHLINDRGEIAWVWGPFYSKEATYTTSEEACEGRYELVVLDSAGDGLGNNFGEISITRDSDNKVLKDKTLYDFGDEYSTTFWVEAEGGGGSTGGGTTGGGTTGGGTTGGGTTGNGPFGCGTSSTKSNCRCCKDVCAANHNSKAAKKNCKTNMCRMYYGRKICDD